MRKRELAIAVATAALLLGSSYAVFAEGSAQSSYSTHTVGTAGSSGVASTYNGGGQQSAQSTGTGGASSGTHTGGGAIGVAGSVQGGGIKGTGSAVLGVGGGSGYAYATGGEKPRKPPKPGDPGFGPGGASALSCSVDVNDFWKWRKLDRHVRQLTLNCQCLTDEHGLAHTANDECPRNAIEIFTAVRN